MESDYPKDSQQWRIAVEQGIGMTEAQGQAHLRAGTFPYKRLEAWLISTYATKAFSPEFAPALRRNLRGLVNWIYGNGEEPFWPGADPAG